MTIGMRAAGLAVLAAMVSAAAPAAAETLTLEAAIARALAATPEQAAAAARIDTLRASRAVADTRPVGSVEVLGENFGLSGRDLNRQIQIGATYNQPIERGGKRTARIGLVEADMAVAQTQAVVGQLNVAERAHALYVEAQAADLRIGLARDRLALAEQMARDASRRVASARDPLFVGSQAKARLAEAQMDLEIALHERDATVTRLAALCGGEADGLAIVKADIAAINEMPLSPAPAAADEAVFAARRQRAAANQALQRASSRTDPIWSLGPRYIGTGDVALVAGLTLPFGNRALNRAILSKADAEAKQVEADRLVAEFEHRQEMALAAEIVNESAHEVESIRKQVIPVAEQALAQVLVGYRRGGFSFYDVAGAATALHDTRTRMLQAAIRHLEAKARLDRLTGRFAPLVQDAQ